MIADTFDLPLEAFRLWLDSKPRDAVVGRAMQSDACPIHQWIEETRGISARCGRTSISYQKDGFPKRFQPPEWVGRFIYELDNATEPTEQIIAQKALAILTASQS